jgi:putative membrane protein
MWAGLAITQLIESFFAKGAWLGWAALALAGLAGLAAIAITLREVTGLLRLNSIEAVQDKAARAINLDDVTAARQALADLQSLYGNHGQLHAALMQLRSHASDIIDPSDRMKLAERLLVEPLDAEARKIVASRARRVALLTTVTPAAALDILFVAAQNFSMLRDIASLYGGKPATFATLRLARMVVSHLAVTGGLALSDSLLQHLLGRGLLGRISARFGEGAVNGILTSRIGLAAIAVCRPIPGDSTSSQSFVGLIREVFTLPKGEEKDADQKPQS